MSDDNHAGSPAIPTLAFVAPEPSASPELTPSLATIPEDEATVSEEQAHLHRCEEIIHDNLQGFLAVGRALLEIREARLYRHRGFKSFEAYLRERWEISRSRADQLIHAAQAAEIVHNCGQFGVLPSNEAQVRPLVGLSPEQQVEAWTQALAKAPGQKVTAKTVKEVAVALACKASATAQFDPVSENIDYAQWAWNPGTGCRHECSCCYARQGAEADCQHFSKGFEPNFHPACLTAPGTTKIPKSREKERGIRNVVVCPIGDLFGAWVPQEWIDAVLAAVRDAPQWNFLFLTKNPGRLVDVVWPANAWVGTSVDCQARVAPAIEALQRVRATVRFLSCKPFLEELRFPTLACVDWVIIGAQTSHGGEPGFQPEPQWARVLLQQAWEAGVRVYCEPSLRTLIREYPATQENTSSAAIPEGSLTGGVTVASAGSGPVVAEAD